MSTTYTAAIGTASDVVTGDFCDVSVAENKVISYRKGEDGEEVPVYSMGDTLLLNAIETAVRIDDEDSLSKAQADAKEVLADHGWTVTGPWEIADNAMYAPVEPSSAQENVIWSVVTGESPSSRAIEPGPQGINVPLEVQDLVAEVAGFSSDIYLLVTPEDEAGEVQGEISWIRVPTPLFEVARIRQALDSDAA